MAKGANLSRIINELEPQASQAALADHVVYGMAKAALDMLTKIMALELGPLGIRLEFTKYSC